MALETLLVSALLPAGIDLVKGLFNRVGQKFAGLTVDEQIKLDASNVSKLEAIAKLDNPYGTPSQWVVNLRAAFRYVAAGILIFGGLLLAGYGAYKNDATTLAIGLETAGAPFSFIFGERMWQGFKK